jgi:hypothetical protein
LAPRRRQAGRGRAHPHQPRGTPGVCARGCVHGFEWFMQEKQRHTQRHTHPDVCNADFRAASPGQAFLHRLYVLPRSHPTRSFALREEK